MTAADAGIESLRRDFAHFYRVDRAGIEKETHDGIEQIGEEWKRIGGDRDSTRFYAQSEQVRWLWLYQAEQQWEHGWIEGLVADCGALMCEGCDDIAAPARILDHACGLGELTIALGQGLEKRAHITATEIPGWTWSFLNHRISQRHALPINVGNALRLLRCQSTRYNRWDIILLIDVLEHLPQGRGAETLERMAKQCDVGLAVSVGGGPNDPATWMHRWDGEGLDGLEALGFTRWRTSGAGPRYEWWLRSKTGRDQA
jgi:hypothetical protein